MRKLSIFTSDVVKHFLSHFEVGNHAVLQGLDNDDIAGSAAQHFLGLLADGLGAGFWAKTADTAKIIKTQKRPFI
jgi:hypothetical protein